MNIHTTQQPDAAHLTTSTAHLTTSNFASEALHQYASEHRVASKNSLLNYSTIPFENHRLEHFRAQVMHKHT